MNTETQSFQFLQNLQRTCKRLDAKKQMKRFLSS